MNNKESKINLFFDDNGEDLQKIIDEVLLKIYIAKQMMSCKNEKSPIQ